MAKKKTKKNVNVPTWLKSKYFLLAVALVLAGVAMLGIKTFAHSRPFIPLPCIGGVTRYGHTGGCVLAAQKGINYICRETPYIAEDSTYNDTFMQNRVKGFQAAVATMSDGVIGPTTWDRLYTRVKNQGPHTMTCKWPR